MYIRDSLPQGFALIDKSWVEATEQGAFFILDNRLLGVPGQPKARNLGDQLITPPYLSA